MGTETQYICILYQNTANCNFFFSCYCQICAKTKMDPKLGIYAMYAKYLAYIRAIYAHICAAYEVCALNLCHVQSGTDTQTHINDIWRLLQAEFGKTKRYKNYTDYSYRVITNSYIVGSNMKMLTSSNIL